MQNILVKRVGPGREGGVTTVWGGEDDRAGIRDSHWGQGQRTEDRDREQGQEDRDRGQGQRTKGGHSGVRFRLHGYSNRCQVKSSS